MKRVLATMCYIDDGENFLMLKRTKKKNDIHEGLTISVGGKFEAGESPEDCVIREVKEETNLNITKPRLRGIISFPLFDGEKDWYTYVFTADNFSGTLTKNCNEGDLVWVKKSEINKITFSVFRCVRAYREISYLSIRDMIKRKQINLLIIMLYFMNKGDYNEYRIK